MCVRARACACVCVCVCVRAHGCVFVKLQLETLKAGKRARDMGRGAPQAIPSFTFSWLKVTCTYVIQVHLWPRH